MLKDLLGRDDSKHKNKNWNLLKSEAFSLNTIVGKAVGEYVGMEWQPALVLVDLFINGDYRGVYALIESIEDGEGRIDIDDDGFIMERDAYYWSEDAYFVSNGNREFTFKYPGYESNEEIASYIIDQVNGFEASLNYKDDRYKEYIDEKTFAAWVLGHDYLGTLDAAGSNMYIYKKDSSDDSKMKMGPMWDFDSNFQMIDELAGIHNSNYCMYKDLFKNYYFNQAYNELFNDTKEGITEHVVNELNKLDFEGLNSSREMEILRWGGTYSIVSEDVERIEDWFESRVQFLEKKIN